MVAWSLNDDLIGLYWFLFVLDVVKWLAWKTTTLHEQDKLVLFFRSVEPIIVKSSRINEIEWRPLAAYTNLNF